MRPPELNSTEEGLLPRTKNALWNPTQSGFGQRRGLLQEVYCFFMTLDLGSVPEGVAFILAATPWQSLPIANERLLLHIEADFARLKRILLNLVHPGSAGFPARKGREAFSRKRTSSMFMRAGKPALPG